MVLFFHTYIGYKKDEYTRKYVVIQKSQVERNNKKAVKKTSIYSSRERIEFFKQFFLF